MKEFAKEFNEKIFPTIKGEDGKGIERFEKIVQQKKLDVERRKKQKRNEELS